MCVCVCVCVCVCDVCIKCSIPVLIPVTVLSEFHSKKYFYLPSLTTSKLAIASGTLTPAAIKVSPITVSGTWKVKPVNINMSISETLAKHNTCDYLRLYQHSGTSLSGNMIFVIFRRFYKWTKESDALMLTTVTVNEKDLPIIVIIHIITYENNDIHTHDMRNVIKNHLRHLHAGANNIVTNQVTRVQIFNGKHIYLYFKYLICKMIDRSIELFR